MFTEEAVFQTTQVRRRRVASMRLELEVRDLANAAKRLAEDLTTAAQRLVENRRHSLGWSDRDINCILDLFDQHLEKARRALTVTQASASRYPR